MAGSNQFPSFEDVTALVRSIVNDDMAGATGTVGEGQVFVDDPTMTAVTLNFLTSSIRELARELRSSGGAQLIRDNYVYFGLTPINSSAGVGVSAPGVHVSLSAAGYNDGLQTNPSILLAPDLIYPLKLWERSSGDTEWTEMVETPDGLSVCDQGYLLREWEYRFQTIWMPGALVAKDVRMRYVAALASYSGTALDYATTYVQIPDATEALAYKVATKYARRLGSPMAADMKTEADQQSWFLRNEQTRALQRVHYERHG